MAHCVARGVKRKRPVRGIFAAFLILVSGHALAREGIQISENPAHAWRSPLATQSLLLAVEKSQDRWITVGERGHILYRQGDGPWQQATAPTRALLTGLSFPNARHGWAVGHDAIILATSDGGRIWRKMHQAIDEQRPLLDVHFQNNNTGFAIGAYGYLLRTEDGGASWHSHSVNPDHDFHLNAIATIPAGLCKSVSENSGSSRGGSPIAVP
ncbi:MAG: hypothetical protein KJO08_02555, partial [Gammaproteobacteria bacterium]|nr:hypothetical protein [Gammaproteobacteria bacterium]